MVKEQKKTTKDLRKDIALQLEISLMHLKELLGEKKFSNRIKKAAKILSEDVVVKEKKVKAVKKDAAPEKIKKAAPAKIQPAAPKAAVKKASKPAPVKKKVVAPSKA